MSLKSDGVRDGITGEDHNSKRQCKRRNGTVSERIVNMAWFTFSEILATTTSLVWPSVTNPLGLNSPHFSLPHNFRLFSGRKKDALSLDLVTQTTADVDELSQVPCH